MAEKKKAAAGATGGSDEKIQETDRQFLERTKVTGMMKDVMGKIIANRPEDPVSFLAEYFESLTEESSPVQKACQYLMMTHHSRPMFENNVRLAYDALSNYPVRKKLCGVSGQAYNELLQELSKDLPPSIVSKLMKKIECFDYEAVPFDIFRSGVFTCCVLQDYVKVCESLFQTLDLQHCGKADRNLCNAVLDQLQAALASSRNDVRRIMESGYSLAPDGLYHVLDKASRRHNADGFMTQDDFVNEAGDAFLAKVRRLK